MALSAAPVVCVAASSITASYASASHRCAPPGRIRGRYVLRPSGKYRYTSQSQIPSPLSGGSKTGLVMRRPFAFCCVVGASYCLQQKCILLFAATPRRRCHVRGVCRQQKTYRTKPPTPAFLLPHTTLMSGLVAARSVYFPARAACHNQRLG